VELLRKKEVKKEEKPSTKSVLIDDSPSHVHKNPLEPAKNNGGSHRYFGEGRLIECWKVRY